MQFRSQQLPVTAPRQCQPFLSSSVRNKVDGLLSLLDEGNELADVQQQQQQSQRTKTKEINKNHSSPPCALALPSLSERESAQEEKETVVTYSNKQCPSQNEEVNTQSLAARIRQARRSCQPSPVYTLGVTTTSNSFNGTNTQAVVVQNSKHRRQDEARVQTNSGSSITPQRSAPQPTTSVLLSNPPSPITKSSRSLNTSRETEGGSSSAYPW